MLEVERLVVTIMLGDYGLTDEFLRHGVSSECSRII
jgi:hypothetical protein